MTFANEAFIERLVTTLNDDAAFNTASRWSDVKVLLRFGLFALSSLCLMALILQAAMAVF